jgi:pimeloyl-ACP methyl ester carboxylesterase
MRRCLADRVILLPSTRNIEARDVARHQVTCPSGDLELLSKRSQASEDCEAEAFVLSFVGNNGRAEGELRRAPRLWADLPVELWAMNYPGFGTSTGPATLRALVPAAISAFDAIAAQACGRPILVTGHSLGAAPALAVSARRPVAGIILHNPPPLRQVIMGKFGWWNLWLGAMHVARSVPSDLDALANARASNCPAVFLLAGRDGLVPLRFQQLVAEAYAGPKQVVDLPKARHNWPVTDEDLPHVKEAMRWLWAHGHP